MALLSKDPAVAVLTQYWRVPGRDCWGAVLCGVIRKVYSGQTGSKILSVRGVRNGREDQYGSFLSLVILGSRPLLFGQEWWDHI
jgi:hypothetical protein